MITSLNQLKQLCKEKLAKIPPELLVFYKLLNGGVYLVFHRTSQNPEKTFKPLLLFFIALYSKQAKSTHTTRI